MVVIVLNPLALKAFLRLISPGRIGTREAGAVWLELLEPMYLF